MAVVLTAAERHRLKKMAYGHKTPHQARQRAAVVLLAARGRGNARIATETHLHVDTVRTWRGRFAHGGLPALADRKRSGRPARFTPVQVAEAKALACQLPAETGVPLSRWSCPELAAELTARGITDSVSVSTVRRWLLEDAVKPWQYRSWIFIRDPDFRAKAQRVLDLYARMFEGVPLGRDEYVVSSDEKTSVQARCRCHPTLAPGQARAMRVNHEYGRGGALAYLAANDVHQLLGRRQRLLTSRKESHRPPGQQVSERDHGPHPRTRLLDEPDRDLLLDRPAQGRLAQRLHESGPSSGPAPSIRRPLQSHGTAVPVEVHHHRPGRSAGPARPTHNRRPTRNILRRPDNLINPRRISGADHLD
ncbi:helix-turn-helix domain-containing protein [Streptomyces sp. WM6373]|uniref:helix-turn-helix domain-containing protein n=1 Tax=Streptomyces sp. WM6373 TaxID=1415556 RepID=UPI000A81DEFF|nr:helix-turn-helix domain-containing protein [Streptomyces sp. WM6373]